MKAEFANTINTIGDTANLSANECERYGMTWGCDGDCPVKIFEMKRITLSIDIDFTPDFWALLPAINLNFGAKQFEFEWLCFGVYAGRLTKNY